VNPVSGAMRIVSEGANLDIVGGMTVYYMHGGGAGGGDAAPGRPSSPALRMNQAQADDRDLGSGATVSSSTVVSAVSQSPPAVSQLAPIEAVAKHTNGNLGSADLHRITATLA